MTVNNPYLAIRAAIEGLGLACTSEALAEPFLRSGQLVRVLEDWSPLFEGFFLYYPGRRQVPAALLALIDMTRKVHGPSPAGNPLANPFAEPVRGHQRDGPGLGREAHELVKSGTGADPLKDFAEAAREELHSR